MLIIEISFNFLYVWNCMEMCDKKFLIYGNCMIRSFCQPGDSIKIHLHTKQMLILHSIKKFMKKNLFTQLPFMKTVWQTFFHTNKNCETLQIYFQVFLRKMNADFCSMRDLFFGKCLILTNVQKQTIHFSLVNTV